MFLCYSRRKISILFVTSFSEIPIRKKKKKEEVELRSERVEYNVLISK